MFEHRTHPLLPRRQFVARALRYASFSGFLIVISLVLGMVGYRQCAGIDWTSAFYNASMILTGMGPALDIDTLPPEQQDRVEGGLTRPQQEAAGPTEPTALPRAN